MSNEVTLPWPPKELSPNSRSHWRVKAQVGKDYKRDVFYLCKAANLSGNVTEKVHLSVNFYPPSRHAFDQDNIIAMMKFAGDGLAEYFGVNDRNFIYHWVYHVFNPDFKGKVMIEIILDPNFTNVVKITEHADNRTEQATK